MKIYQFGIVVIVFAFVSCDCKNTSEVVFDESEYLTSSDFAANDIIRTFDCGSSDQPFYFHIGPDADFRVFASPCPDGRVGVIIKDFKQKVISTQVVGDSVDIRVSTNHFINVTCTRGGDENCEVVLREI